MSRPSMPHAECYVLVLRSFQLQGVSSLPGVIRDTSVHGAGYTRGPEPTLRPVTLCAPRPAGARPFQPPVAMSMRFMG